MIAILTPSRSRPRQFAEMVEATLSLASGAPTGGVRIYCGVDQDDPAWSQYLKLEQPGVVDIFTGQRKQLAGWTNWLLKPALENGATIVASFGDDHRPRTAAWDAHVLDAFGDLGSGLVYTRDGLQDERLPTAPFWSADIVQELGWFFPPVLKHLYADDYWLRLGQDLERIAYLPGVLIEHLHPSAGKSVEDAINRENDAHFDADRDAFERFMAEEHPAIVERLRCVF